jgi:hypothetical protein
MHRSPKLLDAVSTREVVYMRPQIPAWPHSLSAVRSRKPTRVYDIRDSSPRASAHEFCRHEAFPAMPW